MHLKEGDKWHQEGKAVLKAKVFFCMETARCFLAQVDKVHISTVNR